MTTSSGEHGQLHPTWSHLFFMSLQPQCPTVYKRQPHRKLLQPYEICCFILFYVFYLLEAKKKCIQEMFCSEEQQPHESNTHFIVFG